MAIKSWLGNQEDTCIITRVTAKKVYFIVVIALLEDVNFLALE